LLYPVFARFKTINGGKGKNFLALLIIEHLVFAASFPDFSSLGRSARKSNAGYEEAVIRME